MTSRIQEAANAAGAGLGAGLQGAVGQLSAEQQFTFTLYKRLVLPADGFVFYAPASTVAPPITGVVFTFTTNGSLHLSQTTVQEGEFTYTRQDAVFTTTPEIVAFEALPEEDLLYVMTLPNGSLAGFSGQRARYDQADIWHYYGKALLPYEASQFIASPDDIPDENVVSNSLPFWLAMSTDQLPVFPSWLVPQNQLPPFVSVDIQGTRGLAARPWRNTDGSQSQLTAESALFTFYGVKNNEVLDFQEALLDNSEPTGAPYGVRNIPVPVDGKRPQSEFGIIAQQKTMEFQVNYLQSRAREVSRQLILSAFINITLE